MVGSNFKLRKSSVDLLLLSHQRTKEDLAAVADGTFVIDTPGEYEVKGAFIQGFANNGSSVIYSISLGDLTVVWLGPIHNQDLSNGLLEKVKDPDILLLPVGGGQVLNPKEAAAVISQIEPRVVIPGYHRFSGAKELEPVDKFIKEYGAPQQTLDKFKVSRKDLMSEETKVIVLTI